MSLHLAETPRPWRRWLAAGLVLVLGIGAIGVAGLATVIFFPQVAAQNVDHLRDLFGDAAVARLEAAVLSIEDTTQQWGYQVGLVKPASPWTDTGSNLASSAPDGGVVLAPPALAPAATLPAGPAPQTLSPRAGQGLNLNVPDTVTAWKPLDLSPLGSLSGEGVWSPYLQLPDGRAAAYRTFLQPDKQRPYSVAAIVAFDLQATRLHFVLGTVEPVADKPPAADAPARTGLIPAADLQPGVLVAAFNGGFRARHGKFGAMAGGLTALPPIPGLGTVAIYADGHVKIGLWGQDIQDTPDLVAWRQNGQMLIHDGQINPNTAQTTEEWGLTIKGAAITWRSAIGLSEDGRTLYYVAGPQLDVATLTRVMAQAGIAQALQLDINNYWVDFAAVGARNGQLRADPLLKGMTFVDRFFKSYDRDFFYLTAAAG